MSEKKSIQLTLQIDKCGGSKLRSETRETTSGSAYETIGFLISDVLPFNQWTNMQSLMTAIIVMTDGGGKRAFDNEWYAPVIHKLWEVLEQMDDD